METLKKATMPIFKFFELTIDSRVEDEFKKVSVDNFKTSLKNEKGTLSMYSSHKKDNPNVNYIIEVYQNDEVYKVHLNSSQSKKFIEFSKTAVKERKSFEVIPQFLAEKKEALCVEKAQEQKVILAEVVVSIDKNLEFKKYVLEELKEAIKKENNAFLFYATTLKDEPNKWYFLEIYKNNAAFLEHRNSEYVKKYTENVKNMVLSRNIMELVGDTLINRGGLYLEKENI